MARRVISLVRGPGVALRPVDPVLEANAYAVAEDIDLTIVLRGLGVELAVAGGEICPGELAGHPLPPAAGAQDLRGLLESGVDVCVDHDELGRAGLTPDDLVTGVQVADADHIAALLRSADAVLAW